MQKFLALSFAFILGTSCVLGQHPHQNPNTPDQITLWKQHMVGTIRNLYDYNPENGIWILQTAPKTTEHPENLDEHQGTIHHETNLRFSNLLDQYEETGLDAHSSRLYGALPFTMALLNKQITTLDLSENHLTGDLSYVSELTSLTTLNLSSNQFTGDMSSLKNLTNLKKLYLASNPLSGHLHEIRMLVNLMELSLAHTHTRGNLLDMNHLTNLIELSLGYTFITGNLSDVTPFKKLEKLYLAYTKIKGHLQQLRSMKQLRIAYLYGTNVKGKASDLQSLSLNTLLLGDAHTNYAKRKVVKQKMKRTLRKYKHLKSQANHLIHVKG